MKPSERRTLTLLLEQQIAELADRPASVAEPFREALARLHQLPAEGET